MTRLRLISPSFLILATFGATFATWYFMMPANPMLPGIAPRLDRPEVVLFFLFMFSAFLFGVYIVGFFSKPVSAKSLSDREWLAVGIVAAAITLAADALFMRGALFGGDPELFRSDSFSDNITTFASYTRKNSEWGLTSLNNLFPIPASIGAMLMFTKRRIPPSLRRYAILLFAVIASDTLFHGILGLGRIWFLSILLTAYAAWIFQRRPPLGVQIAVFVISMVAASGFVVVMELLRSVGVQAHRAGIDLSDGRLLLLVFTRLSQAYIASNMNNALIVIDCHPAVQLISTWDVPSKIAENVFGVQFESYGNCPEWTSWFGTLNFLALLWWDWGYGAFIVAFAIGAAIQVHFLVAVHGRQDQLTLAAVALPNTLLACMHLTTANFVGSTEFLLPALFVLAIWLACALGERYSTTRATA